MVKTTVCHNTNGYMQKKWERKKAKRRIIIDLVSTEDPAHGKQEGVAHRMTKRQIYRPVFVAWSAEAVGIGGVSAGVFDPKRPP